MIKADLSEPLLFNHDMSINVSYGHYYDTFPTHWHNFMEIIAPLTGDYYATIGTDQMSFPEYVTAQRISSLPPDLDLPEHFMTVPAFRCRADGRFPSEPAAHHGYLSR